MSFSKILSKFQSFNKVEKNNDIGKNNTEKSVNINPDFIDKEKIYSLKKQLEKMSYEDSGELLSCDDIKYIRASKIYSFCPREEILKIKHSIKTGGIVSYNDSLVFSFGRLLHNWLQNEIFSDILLGQWKCNSCGELYGNLKDLSFKPNKCKKCNNVNFTFVEMFLHDANLKLGGHPDGFILSNLEGELELVDFKSINANGYSNLEMFGVPENYVWQGNSYLLLSGLTRIRFIYVNKNVPAFREKVIVRDENIINEIKSKCIEFIEACKKIKEKDFILPERKLCDSKDCKRAKVCPVRDLCFFYPKKT